MARKKLSKFIKFKTYPNCYIYKNGLRDYNFSDYKPENLIKLSNFNILELCAGYCEYGLEIAIQNLSNINCKVICVDIRSDRLTIGCRKSNELKLTNINYLCKDINDINSVIPNKSVDRILMVHPDPSTNNKKNRLNQIKYLEKYFNILKDDGIFVLITDNSSFYQETLSIIKNYELGVKIILEEDNMEQNLQSKEIFINCVGLDIVKTRFNQEFVKDDNGTKVIILAKIEDK